MSKHGAIAQLSQLPATMFAVGGSVKPARREGPRYCCDPRIGGGIPGFTFHGHSLTTARVTLDMRRTGTQHQDLTKVQGGGAAELLREKTKAVEASLTRHW